MRMKQEELLLIYVMQLKYKWALILFQNLGIIWITKWTLSFTIDFGNPGKTKTLIAIIHKSCFLIYLSLNKMIAVTFVYTNLLNLTMIKKLLLHFENRCLDMLRFLQSLKWSITFPDYNIEQNFLKFLLY